MKKIRTTIILLLCVALTLCGCAAGETSRREPVRELTCTQPAALSGIYPAGGSKLYICSSDYEAERTTVQLVDAGSDAVCGEVTLDGVWSIKSQSFSDGRLALCDRAITLTDTMSADEELYGISAALDALSRTLSLYPDGFFAQFKNGMGEGGIRFLLTERIDSDYGVVGCAYESREWQNIALDGRMADGLDTIICHELWHATENHILSRDYSAFSPDAWAAMNPEGFAYCEDPTQSDSMLEWTLYSSSPDNVYFVDGYSCVNEREDRARIMEYFMVHEDEAGLLIESPAIRQKLQFMCDAVRNNFDTTGWSAVRWESLLR